MIVPAKINKILLYSYNILMNAQELLFIKFSLKKQYTLKSKLISLMMLQIKNQDFIL